MRYEFENDTGSESHILTFPWDLIRLIVLTACGVLIYASSHFPEHFLFVFWTFVIPILPLIFWLVPGLWRNICPLATANQLPRMLGISLNLSAPEAVARYASILGTLALFVLIPARHLYFNQNLEALQLMLVSAAVLAMFGGFILKGKSGWCGSFCPLMPIQRLYGHTPVVVVSNTHCKTCVGCSKNCYDFDPQESYLADAYDSDRHIAIERTFFAGALPGLIYSYFTATGNVPPDPLELYLDTATHVAVGAGLFFAASAVTKLSIVKLSSFSSIVCINMYYWFATPDVIEAIQTVLDVRLPPWAGHSFQTIVGVLSLQWLRDAFRKEAAYLDPLDNPSSAALGSRHIRSRSTAPKRVVTVSDSGERFEFKNEETLLQVLERNGQNISFGCKMGACGADVVEVVEGTGHLSQPSQQELATLKRLGYGTGARLACCAKLTGSVTIALKPSQIVRVATESEFEIDSSVRKVVIVGGGIAGVTAADNIRRHHEDCDVTLIGAERYPLYNRMAIAKAIYGKQALHGLSLLPDNWCQERDINLWLNSQVAKINKKVKQVYLATGEVLAYDRLILATGSASFMPAIDGREKQGCFSLRTADDATEIRSYIQRTGASKAIVIGGGVLGIEIASALLELDLNVTIIERSDQLLRRQLDLTASRLLERYLTDLGVCIKYRSNVDRIFGGARVAGIETVGIDVVSRDMANHSLESTSMNGWSIRSKREMIEADIVLVAAGIRPNTSLAREAGLKVNIGVLVNSTMQTSDPSIFAAGDIAELHDDKGRILGLWPVAVDQARIAAINSLGANQTFLATHTAMTLKVPGIELMAIGDVHSGNDDADTEICLLDNDKYRKLVLRRHRIVGAILVGHPQFRDGIVRAINSKVDVRDHGDQLRSGDWSCIDGIE